MRAFLTGPFIRLAPVVFVILSLQRTVLSEATFRGVVMPLALACAASIGAAAGSERGTLGAFTVGLMYDLAAGTPLGLTALVFALAAFVAGYVLVLAPVAPWWLAAIFAGLGAAVGELAQPIARTLIGNDGWFNDRLFVIVPVAFVFTLVVAPLLVPVGRWCMRVKPPRWKAIQD